jgi:D-alanine transaminase
MRLLLSGGRVVAPSREDTDKMPRLAYVDGRMTALADAQVSVEDRGFQFADGVYEVCAVLNGRLLDWQPHLARLARSRGELSIAAPMADAALDLAAHRVVAANRIRDGLLYIQVTRGRARRDHPFPKAARPTLVMTARPFDFRQRVAQQRMGVAVVTQPEIRWARRDIKSVSLLPNVLAKQAAKAAGAFEAWFVDGERVTEGGSTNAWIVKDGVAITHPADHDILAGVMRDTLIRVARDHQYRVQERPFTLAEALAADEAFITSTTAPCLPVVTIDGRQIAEGRPGTLTACLAELLWTEIERQTGWRR